MAEATKEREIAALNACADYEGWAAEVRRLTEEIGNLVCPRQAPGHENLGVPAFMAASGESCFEAAKKDLVNWREGLCPEDPRRPPLLADLAKVVADCPECSRLCELIAARKHARQRFGVAKRAVRHVGKRVLAGLVLAREAGA